MAKIKGLPELRRKLERLREKTAPKVMEAMARGSQLVVDRAQSLVPVDTGSLRDSIGWTFDDAPKGSLRIASAKAGSLRVTIFAGNKDAYYSRFVEFGTAPHINGGIFKGSQNPGAPAQPFFFPSWRANKKKLQSLLRSAIRDAVKEAVR
jgi:HK97 gp10 family phage protein